MDFCFSCCWFVPRKELQRKIVQRRRSIFALAVGTISEDHCWLLLLWLPMSSFASSHEDTIIWKNINQPMSVWPIVIQNGFRHCKTNKAHWKRWQMQRVFWSFPEKESLSYSYVNGVSSLSIFAPSIINVGSNGSTAHGGRCNDFGSQFFRTSESLPSKSFACQR